MMCSICLFLPSNQLQSSNPVVSTVRLPSPSTFGAISANKLFTVESWWLAVLFLRKPFELRTSGPMNAYPLFQNCFSTTRCFVVPTPKDSRVHFMKLLHTMCTKAPCEQSTVRMKSAASIDRLACSKANIITNANISESISQNANYLCKQAR